VVPTGHPVGWTTITVADLFYNVPARRKYLKQDGTEFAHVNTIVTSYALANPDVAVTLEHDGRETVATTGEGDLRDAVMAVYGREVASGMVDVAARDDDGSLPEGPLDGVTGLVSHPETNRASNEYVSTYVNGRYVRSGTVREAIVDAYGTQLASDRYPFAVCFLDLPGDSVDVNVHPQKMEVRFADPDGVRSQVRTAVEDALLEAGLVRSSAPRGRSAPAQTEIQPGGEDDGGDSQESTSASSPPTERRDPIGPADVRDASTDTPGSDDPTDGRTGDVGSNSRPADDSGPADGAGSADAGHHGRPIDAEDEPDADVGNHGSPDGARFRPATEQTRLGEGEDADGDEGRSFERLPAMRVLGQLHDTYLVAETPDGLVLVDQHAADERVNYERLRERLAGDTTTQTLADPVSLSLTAREAALFETYEAALASLGFGATRTGDRTVEVGAVPELVAEAAGPELLREVLSAFVTGEAAAAETVEATADDLLADLACYPSITGNTSLTEGSVRTLLAALDDCENPWACPHGRPVVIELDREEIEARFERDYPGHGGH
jgi:DNA mismatch repair protein MutL